VERIEAWLTYPSGVRLFQTKVEQGKTCTVRNPQGQDVHSPDSCPLTHSYTFDGGNPIYPAGQYTVEFLAYDHAGNPAGEKSWTFTKGDLTDPILLSLTHSPTLPTGWVKQHGGRVTGTATDIGTGLHRLELTEPLDGGDQTRQKRYKSPGSQTDCDGSLTRPCPAAGDEYFDYTTSNYREGRVSASVKAVDASGRPSNLIGYNLKIDRGGPTLATPTGRLWDFRNRTDDHRLEGLYDRFHSVHLEATDGNNASDGQRRSGVKAINVRVLRPDGSVIINSPDPSPQGCPGDSCGKPRDFQLDGDSIPDGDYTIEVVAVDQLDNPSAPTRWDVTVDRRGDVYQATEWTANPGAGGELVSREWTRFGHWESRSESGSDIATRRTIQCPGSDGPAFLCGEVRHRLLEGRGSTPRDEDDFDVKIGETPDDERLEPVSDLTMHRPPGEVDSTGPITDAAEPWQRLPPAHGTTYELWRAETVTEEGDEDDPNAPRVVVLTWVDQATKLPIKQDMTLPDGSGSSPIFFDYLRGRFETSQVASDHFAVPRPADPNSESSEEYRGSAQPQPAQTRDRETGTFFKPMWLGTGPAVNLLALCYGGTMVYESDVDEAPLPSEPDPDPEEEPHEAGLITAVDADYRVLGLGAPCTPGLPDERDPDLTISTYAATSTVGAQWQATYDAATTELLADPSADPSRVGRQVLPVGLELATVYWVPYSSDEIAALVDLGEIVLTLKGPYLTDDDALRLILAGLEEMR
jgi:hypothetical protein